MWDSVRDAVAILVGGNLGELGFILVGSALTGTSPLNPRQLLLVNLLTDMAPALAIALREPPDRTAETLLHAGPDASLGAHARQADRDPRRARPRPAPSTAWMIARLTGTPTRARTVALAALVGTQLGQTVAIGGRSPLVLGATALSAGGARHGHPDAGPQPVLRLPAARSGRLVHRDQRVDRRDRRLDRGSVGARAARPAHPRALRPHADRAPARTLRTRGAQRCSRLTPGAGRLQFAGSSPASGDDAAGRSGAVWMDAAAQRHS